MVPSSLVLITFTFKVRRRILRSTKETRESAAHPRPLGMRVLMWDEVKLKDKNWLYFRICKFLRLSVFVK